MSSQIDHNHLRHCKKIGVIGGAAPAPQWLSVAYEVGQLVAQRGALLVCGGMGGVMAEAARGAKQAGGITVGILPGLKGEDANEYIDIPILTNMGHARNVIVVQSADGVIAINGSYGTLTEIAFCLLAKIPLVGINTWKLEHEDYSGFDIPAAQNASQAVTMLYNQIDSIEKMKP